MATFIDEVKQSALLILEWHHFKSGINMNLRLYHIFIWYIQKEVEFIKKKKKTNHSLNCLGSLGRILMTKSSLSNLD